MVEYDNVRANLQILAGSEPSKAMGIYRYPDQVEYRVDDVTKFQPIQAIWKTMINVGTIELLLSLQMTPFLDLSLKGDYTLLSQTEIIYRSRKPQSQSSNRTFVNKVSALLRHCINTFGANTVERWGVEIGALHDEMLSFLERPEDYADRFKTVYRMIKEWLPNMPVGGPDHNIAMETDFMKKAMALLQKDGVMFDFLSLCAVPHTRTLSEDGSTHFVVSPSPNYIRDCVRECRDILDHMGLAGLPIWVIAFGPEVRTRNHVSDSCYQATFIAKNTIDLIGLVDVIGYWQLSDIDTEYIDPPHPVWRHRHPVQGRAEKARLHHPETAEQHQHPDGGKETVCSSPPTPSIPTTSSSTTTHTLPTCTACPAARGSPMTTFIRCSTTMPPGTSRCVSTASNTAAIRLSPPPSTGSRAACSTNGCATASLTSFSPMTSDICRILSIPTGRCATRTARTAHWS